MTAIEADLILCGGRIFTGLGAPHDEALAVHQGRVLAAGTTADIESLRGPATEVIDLRGRAAFPGFNDCHQHLLSLGLSLIQINLRPETVTQLDRALTIVRDKAAELGPGRWIFGGRYDHFHLDVKRHPLRHELDQAAPDNPVFIKRLCGHMGVANSKALALAGISPDTPDPQGGLIERRDGRLTGLLSENAQQLVTDVIPHDSPEVLVDALEAAGRHMLARGATSVMDAGVGMLQGAEDMAAFQTARRRGRLPLRAYLAIYGGPTGIVEACAKLGLVTGAGDEFLKIGPAKLFTDGSAGGRTAAMTQPYLSENGGDDDETGLFVYPDAELDAYAADYLGKGYQLAIHAIGDAAIEQSLNAIERAKLVCQSSFARHRIEHCGFSTPAQIQRMRALGVLPVPQPIFIREFGDLYVEVLGEARSAVSYPMRSWQEAGLHPGASSDTPVCRADTLPNLHALLTRQTAGGRVLGGDECLDMETALHTMTYNGAYASLSEAVKGTLQPGKLADIAVADRDLFAAPVEDLLEAEIDLTFVDGLLAHDRLGETGRATAAEA